MTEPTPEKKEPNKKTPITPLDYHSPINAATSAGCFVFALCLLILVSIYAALALLIFSGSSRSNNNLLILTGGIVFITAAAILSRKFGLSAAVALLLAALCIFLLTFSLCSNFSVYGH